MAYTRVNWQNNISTPINATKLNIMDAGINDHEGRISNNESQFNNINTNGVVLNKIVDNTDNRISFLPAYLLPPVNWTHSTDANYYNGTKSVGNTTNQTILFTFYNSGIEIYAAMGSSHGIVELFLDGVSMGTFDRYSPTSVYQQLMYSVTGLPVTTHTIKIVITGNKNASSAGIYFGFDYFKLLDTETLKDISTKSTDLAYLRKFNAILLGFKKNDATFNNTLVYNALKAKLNEQIVVYFPPGKYAFDETFVDTNKILFEADGKLNSTQFAAFRDNQDYIFKIGGNLDYSVPLDGANAKTTISNFSMDGFSFMDYPYTVTKALVYIEFATQLRFNFSFWGNNGRALYIRNSWEIDFDNLVIRPYHPTASQIYFGPRYVDSSSNLSRILFKNIDVEYYNTAALLECVSGANANNIMIENISIEDIPPKVADASSPTGYTDLMTIDTFTAMQKSPLFILDDINGFTIGTMNITELAKRYYIDNSVSHVTTLFSIGNLNTVKMDIDTICLNATGAFVQLIDGVGNKYNDIYINAVTASPNNAWITKDWYNSNPFRAIYLFYKMNNGSVVIANTNCVENKFTITYSQELLPGTYTYKNLLYKVINAVYDNLVSANVYPVYDTTLNKYVILKGSVSTYYTFTQQLTCLRNSRIYIKYKSDGDATLRKFKNAVETPVTIPTSATYTTFTFDYITTDIDYFLLASLANVYIEYIVVQFL